MMRPQANKQKKHQEFLIQLDNMANFFNSLIDSDGKKIPIIFIKKPETSKM